MQLCLRYCKHNDRSSLLVLRGYQSWRSAAQSLVDSLFEGILKVRCPDLYAAFPTDCGRKTVGLKFEVRQSGSRSVFLFRYALLKQLRVGAWHAIEIV